MAESFLDSLISLVMDMAGNEWLKDKEARRLFESDVRTFMARQRLDTTLDIFKFAVRPDVKRDTEFIPLEDIYVPLRVNQENERLASREQHMRHFDPTLAEYKDPDKLPENVDIVQLLDFLDKGDVNRQIMIIGEGGSGKSTFAKYLCRLFGSDDTRKVKVLREKDEKWKLNEIAVKNQFFPLFIRLRDLEGELVKYNQRDWKDNFSLERFFETRYGQRYETPGFLTKLIRHFPCLVIFDGIDEVPEGKDLGSFLITRNAVIEWITGQTQILANYHPKTAVILTSRETDRTVLARHFQIFKVQSFNEAEIRQFTKGWYEAYGKVLEYNRRTAYYQEIKADCETKLQQLSDNQSSFEKGFSNAHIREMISNPLLLSQAILIHSIDNSFEVTDVETLYGKFVQTMLYQWDQVRQMEFYPQLLGSNNFHEMERLIRRIAYFFSKRNATKLAVKEFFPDMVNAIRRFKDRLPEPDKIEELALELLRQFRDRAGLLTGRMVGQQDLMETEFEFQAKPIQDYLTAYALLENNIMQNGEFTLYDKVGDPFWNRTLEFYVKIPVGNIDFFFADYIQRLEPNSNEALHLHHFTAYFLMAREKNPELNDLLVEKCWAILQHSNDFVEVRIANGCLSRLDNLPWKELEAFIKDPSNIDVLTSFRQGKVGQLFYLKNKYDVLRSLIMSILTQDEENDKLLKNFDKISSWLPLIWFAKDYICISMFMASVSSQRVCALWAYYSYQDLHALREFDEIRTLLHENSINNGIKIHPLGDIKISKELWMLQTIRVSMDLIEILILKNLYDLRSLGGLINFRNQGAVYLLNIWGLVNVPELGGVEKFEQLKRLQTNAIDTFLQNQSTISPYLRASAQKNLAILRNLTPEQKRQYFNYVDEA